MTDTDSSYETNQELLESNVPNTLLSSLDQQRRFLLRKASIEAPCPNCGTKQNVFQAAGISIEDYDFGRTQHKYHCISCGRELIHCIPLVSVGAAWLWALVPQPVQKIA